MATSHFACWGKLRSGTACRLWFVDRHHVYAAMNWEATGTCGGTLGATGVIGTLLYPARQTRINTRAIESTFAREVTIAESELESIEFRTLAISVVPRFGSHHVDRNLQVGHEEETKGRLSVTAGLINKLPAWRKYWEEETQDFGFSHSFIDTVDSQVGIADFPHMAGGKSADE